MAFTFTLDETEYVGRYKRFRGTWTTTSATTTGTIILTNHVIVNSKVQNITDASSLVVDDTTNKDRIAISGVTATDVGVWEALCEG